MNDHPSLNAFPAGALRINHAGGGPGLPMLVLALVIALCGVGLLAWGLPGLLQDWRISRDPVSINASIKGKCSTHFAFLTDCDVTLKYHQQSPRVGVDRQSMGVDYDLLFNRGQLVEVDRHFFFFSLGGKDYTVQPVALAGDHSQMTLDLGIEKLYNRLVFLLLAVGIILLAAWQALLVYRRARPLNQFGKNRTVQLRPVMVTLPKEIPMALSYKWVNGGQTRTFFTRFSKQENGPFLLGTKDDKSFDALAVVPQGSDIAILLDDALTRVELSEDQKQALYRSRES